MTDKSHHPDQGENTKKIDESEKKIIVKEKSKVGQIAISGGVPAPQNYEEYFRIAQQYVSSGMLPKTYNTPEKVVTGMQYAHELGLQPLTALRQIAVVNGNPSLFGDLPLALVRQSGTLDSIKEWLFDQNGKEINLKNKNIRERPFGAACKVKRKGEQPHTATFTIEDALQAGLNNKDVWKHYTKTMLKYRSRSMALKDVFPDVLNGISIAEYDSNDLPRDVRGPLSPSDEVNEDRDDRITDEKVEKIKIIDKLFEELKYNEAQILRYKNQYAKCEDLFFATDSNLSNLTKALLTVQQKGESDG